MTAAGQVIQSICGELQQARLIRMTRRAQSGHPVWDIAWNALDPAPNERREQASVLLEEMDLTEQQYNEIVRTRQTGGSSMVAW